MCISITSLPSCHTDHGNQDQGLSLTAPMPASQEQQALQQWHDLQLRQMLECCCCLFCRGALPQHRPPPRYHRGRSHRQHQQRVIPYNPIPQQQDLHQTPRSCNDVTVLFARKIYKGEGHSVGEHHRPNSCKDVTELFTSRIL